MRAHRIDQPEPRDLQQPPSREKRNFGAVIKFGLLRLMPATAATRAADPRRGFCSGRREDDGHRDRIGGLWESMQCSDRRRCHRHRRRQLATPWGSYVRGDLSIVSTSNLPAEAQIDVANFSAALFASQITRLSYAESCLSLSGPADRIGSRGIPAVSGRMFYFLFPGSSGIRRCQEYLCRTIMGREIPPRVNP